MNKNAMILASLVMSNVCGVFGFNEEQREVLYTLRELGRDYASEPLIIKNIDTFIATLELNILLNEKRLQVASGKLKSSLYKSGLLCAGFLGYLVGTAGLGSLVPMKQTCRLDSPHPSTPTNSWHVLIPIFSIINVINTLSVVGFQYVGVPLMVMNIHDARKAKNMLAESLALDRDILAELQGIKASLPEDLLANESMIADDVNEIN